MDGGLVLLARLRLLSFVGRRLSSRPLALLPGRVCLPGWNLGRRIVRLAFGRGSFSAKRHRLMNASNHLAVMLVKPY